MRVSKGKGFTLIEIVIAMTLSVLLFMIVFSALRLGEKSQEKGIEREDISQRMRIISDRITWLIKGAYPYIVKKQDETVLYFSGTSSSLGLVTTSVDTYSEKPQDLGGLKWIKILRDEDGLKIKENVFISEDNLDGTGGEEYVFDPYVSSIGFEYLDTVNEGDKGTWSNNWSKEKDYLPSLVKIKIVLEHEGKKVEMPPIVTRIMAGGAESLK